MKEGFTILKNWILKAEELYKNGYSYCKISEILKINRKLISYELRQLGYKSKSRYLRKTYNDTRKYDYSCCDQIFKSIDTEEKAYWLGFLYADGYVSEKRNTVSLCLKEMDVDHVKAFRNFLNLDNKPLHKKEKNNKYIEYEFSFSSLSCKNDLIALGCTPKKSLTLTFPRGKFDKLLYRHFIRGYFDGDGCISNVNKKYPTVEILGTSDFLSGILECFPNSTNAIYGFNHSSVKRIQYFGKYSLKFLKYIYHDSHVFLDRKHNRYLFAVQSRK